MQEYLIRTWHRPRPLPPGRWNSTQRWNDLLFAHWPVSAAAVQAFLPESLDVDVFQGSAWVGMVPFWLDRIKFRGMPALPGMRGIPDLNLRTYVRERDSGAQGVYCFSIDASSLLAVAAARTAFHLPYYWAEMHFEQRSEREFAFYSRRHLAPRPVIFKVRYRGLGPTRRLAEIAPGTLEYFLTERYCLFTRNHVGLPVRANIHPVPSPLEEAEAEIERNDLAAATGIQLPPTPPVLHYSRRLAIYIWPAELVRPALARRPVTVAVTPS
ncbi:MAG TPA: DUF2071 domain-containing protein [Terracidiphilus sp.]|nr:DUF2071 domain-containing protein [Terracidiphilus sp.]